MAYTASKKELRELSKLLVDEGKLIEAGFLGFRDGYISPKAPELQVKEMKLAFMAGAQHLFASIMTILDPGIEPTEDDLRRMNLVNDELQQFAAELEAATKARKN